MGIKLSTIITRDESILFSELDDKIVMMSIDNGEYYALDPFLVRHNSSRATFAL